MSLKGHVNLKFYVLVFVLFSSKLIVEEALCCVTYIQIYVLSATCFILFLKDFMYVCIFRERETNVDAQEKHPSVASCTHLSGDLAQNLGNVP